MDFLAANSRQYWDEDKGHIDSPRYTPYGERIEGQGTYHAIEALKGFSDRLSEVDLGNDYKIVILLHVLEDNGTRVTQAFGTIFKGGL